MPQYRIHRLRPSLRQQFRTAAHTTGLSTIKAKDYEPADEITADTPYSAWSQLRDAPAPLEIGDILETETGELGIFKYVGFEEARWFVPEAQAPDSASFPGTGANHATIVS